MTANAINAMRLQEEKRHNLATEEENIKGRKSDFASNILGATLRGLGTGVLGNITSGVRAARSLKDIANKANKNTNNNTKKGGRK